MNTDAKTIRLVIGGLVVVMLGMLALIGVIAVQDSPGEVPEALWTAFGVGIGALASLLARTSTGAVEPVAQPQRAEGYPPGSGTFPGKAPNLVAGPLAPTTRLGTGTGPTVPDYETRAHPKAAGMADG